VQRPRDVGWREHNAERWGARSRPGRRRRSSSCPLLTPTRLHQRRLKRTRHWTRGRERDSPTSASRPNRPCVRVTQHWCSVSGNLAIWLANTRSRDRGRCGSDRSPQSDALPAFIVAVDRLRAAWVGRVRSPPARVGGPVARCEPRRGDDRSFMQPVRVRARSQLLSPAR
jgi:hypothetical protein